MPTSSIIDNRDGNTLLSGLAAMSAGGTELRIATAFFSLDALMLLSDTLEGFDRVRILFGDDANAEQRRRLLDLLRQRSDADLLAQREKVPVLTPLKKIEALFEAGKVEARCYTTKKFHAKAYLIDRPAAFPYRMGVIGSGNFTRPGLTQNIELNTVLSTDQTEQLAAWFEERWTEAKDDVVTLDLLKEVRRQVELYDPYILYLKALYTWGESQQIEGGGGDSTLMDDLDPHVLQGYRRAVRIIERENGVMICDGVGLGKTFIALALMEHYCRLGLNVLLVAPKSILESSWRDVLRRYLLAYMDDFGNVKERPMTDFGHEAIEQFNKRSRTKAGVGLLDLDDAPPNPGPALLEKWRKLDRLSERIDVVIVDESHNFRTSSAARYLNLMRVLKPFLEKRKKVALLTATPINTAYRDISNQLALITHEHGRLAGYSIEQIRKTATNLDKDNDPGETAFNPQLALTGLTETNSGTLNTVLESCVIQRSRATVRKIALDLGKEVLFPKRNGPFTRKVEIGPESDRYRKLIDLADRLFRPGVKLIADVQKALQEPDKTKREKKLLQMMQATPKGIKLAAFLLEQYRREPDGGGEKTMRDEVHLARLVFSNTLKQFECSPPAFQGIIQSLGAGLLARLSVAFSDSAGQCPPDVEAALTEHIPWVRTPIFKKSAAPSDPSDPPDPSDDTGDDDEDETLATGESQDASGEEGEAWLTQAVKSRGLVGKLAGFGAATYDVERWKRDILADLGYLKLVHTATLEAREQPDPKFERVFGEIQALRGEGKKILVFTQSQRTAQYLESELKERLKTPVGRIDSHVETTRAAILYAFSPSYNSPAKAQSIPANLDLLICTDVLSEGVNLQEADAILSYDIHWNPVRLIQRIGRVDRRLKPDLPASLNKSFDIINILPPNLIESVALLRSCAADMAETVRRGGGIGEWIWKGAPSGAAFHGAVIANPQPGLPLLHTFQIGAINQTFTILDEEISDSVATDGKSNPALHYRLTEAPVITAGGLGGGLGGGGGFGGGAFGGGGGFSGGGSPRYPDQTNSVLRQLRDPVNHPQITYLAAQYERIRMYREWTFGPNTVFRVPQRADMRNDRLEEDFSNLGLFLNRMRRHPEAKKSILGYLRDIYEGVDDFDVSVEGGTVQVFFTEGRFTIPATRLSDGTLRYLCLLAILCDPTPPPLICIEEPELGLHPDILPKVADLLVEASTRTQLIVTTHSDILVDAMTERPEVVLVCEKHEGQTQIKRLSSDDLAVWLEKYRLGELWTRGELGGTRW